MDGIMLLILLCSSFYSVVQSSVDEPLDVILHEHGLKALLSQQPRHRTGTLYDIKLPANLSGVNVSYVKLRSKTLWERGANFSGFRIPSRTLPMPYVKRIVIMYQDLGNNWSSQFFYNNHTFPGYSLASSVVGFSVYDASNLSTRDIRKLDFNTCVNAAAISVRFGDLKFSRGVKCASVGGSDGTVSLGDIGVGNVCYTRSYGEFLVVIPTKKKKREMWVQWGVGTGFVTVLVVSFVGLMLVKMMKLKRLDEMEMQMEEGSVDLETVWIGYSKMPYATVTRTQANLENVGRPT